MASAGVFLEHRVKLDLQREERRQEERETKRMAEEKKEKLDLARSVLAIPDADDDLKAAATRCLHKALKF